MLSSIFSFSRCSSFQPTPCVRTKFSVLDRDKLTKHICASCVPRSACVVCHQTALATGRLPYLMDNEQEEDPTTDQKFFCKKDYDRTQAAWKAGRGTTSKLSNAEWQELVSALLHPANDGKRHWKRCHALMNLISLKQVPSA